MVIVIEGQTANQLFRNTAQKLLSHGNIVEPRNMKTIELLDAWLVLHQPEKNIVSMPERNISYDYLQAELDWYLSGDLSTEFISKYAGLWERIANPDGSINSNYGYLSLHQKINGVTQYDWCRNKLIGDISSRQAIINYNQPMHKYVGNKDFVCTISQQFRVRDDLLDSVVLMRSNDLIYGLSYDLPWFAFLQKKLGSDIGVGLGRYNHYAQSLHVYEKHFGMLEDIAGSSAE